MVNGGVDIKTHFIRMLDLALNLPVELRMGFLGWTLHLCIDAKTHGESSCKSSLRGIIDTRGLLELRHHSLGKQLQLQVLPTRAAVP